MFETYAKSIRIEGSSLNLRFVFKFQKKILFYLLIFYFLLISTAGATDCIIEAIPNDQYGAPIEGLKIEKLEVVEIPYWQFLIWLAAVNLLSTFDLLGLKKMVFTIAGYRTVTSGNVLENPSRFRVYTYIKTKPGAYISEIVEKIDLDRETVKYHIKTLKAKRKIEAYREGGKTRYFENILIYNESEKKVISALQNLTNQKIILEIINEKCDTNAALAEEFRVSKPTISWYIKNLKENGLIIEMKEGKKIIYRINPANQLLIEKYIYELQSPYNNSYNNVCS
ncbi:MAG: winged helix-turn-helix transcriptional regulator [Methanosarcina sp.]